MTKSNIASLFVVASTLSLSLVACGSDEPSRAHGTVSSTNASATLEGMTALRTAMASHDGDALASDVMSLTSLGQTLVVPTGAYGREAPRGLVPIALADRMKARSPSFTGSATCDDSGCTYDNFGDDNEYGSYRVNGHITAVGDHVSIDLTYDITTGGITLDWAMQGEITANATLIDGFIHSQGASSSTDPDNAANGYAITWNVDMDFDAIGFDGAGCATSGRLAVGVDYTVRSAQGGGSYAVEGAIGFGPACGQYTIE